MISANIIEIFSSIQGEGKYVGCKQIFIRLAGCNLSCNYCDTNFVKNDFFDVYKNDCKVKEDNPATIDKVINIINDLSLKSKIHSISFTGGEPLLQAEFIKNIAERVDHKIFLETNGTLPKKLKEIINYIDIISMDIKLPSATTVNLFEQHKQFIEIAKEKDLYIKVVISDDLKEDEFLQALMTVASVSKDILFILQPVTPINGVKPLSVSKILYFQELASQYLNDVRIIPQTHKILNLL